MRQRFLIVGIVGFLAGMGVGCGGRASPEAPDLGGQGGNGTGGTDGGKTDGDASPDRSSEAGDLPCPALDDPMGGTVSAPDLTSGATAVYTCKLGSSLKGAATRTCQANGTWSGAAPSCSAKDCGPLLPPKDGTVSAPDTTFGGIATYACGKGFGPSGSSTRTCQLDGTWSGTNPSCVAADCPPLPGPSGGTVVAPTLTFGSTATYSCASGYMLVGMTTRLCQSDGSWSAAAPTCAINDCGPLKAPTNGSSTVPATTYGAMAVFTCEAGYALSGAATITCQSDGTWSAAVPSCAAKDCGPLTAPANGAVDVPVTTLDAAATYSCKTGYGLSSNGRRVCQASGTWSGDAPSCVIKTCAALTAPANGSVAVSAMTFGGTATYSCADGYGPSGSSTRTCQADGTWSGTEPACVVANCPALASPAGGTVSAPALTFGAMATYSCETGFDRSGPASRTCQADKTWSGTAPTCVIKDCGALTGPMNGAVSAATTTYGATATYSCGQGYSLSAGATRTCQADGTWSGSAPTCTIKDCGALSNPTKGTVAATTTTYGATATYACSAGYDLVGPATRMCQADGKWSGQPPTCSLKDCGGLTSPANGSVNAPTTTYGSTASYSCMTGYGPSGSSTRTCQADGMWSGSAPTCVIANCPSLPQPVGGSVSAPVLTFGATATYSCNSGYNLNGATTRTCQADGFWSGTQPTCDPKNCGAAPVPTNGSVSAPMTTYGATATYSCNTGYVLTGGTSRTCQADATWSASTPSCIAKDCGVLAAPTNGSVVANPTTVGATATYSCNTNFTISGTATRTCQASGAWSGAAPTCVDVCSVGGAGTPSHCCNSSVCTGGYVCAASVCKTTCASNADCQTDAFCWSNACHADVVSLSEGFQNTCAALKDGRVFCWGDSGLLGAGASLPSTVPVQIAGITDAASVRVGVGIGCALLSGGTVKCWGTGILGDGVDPGVSSTPKGPVIVANAAGGNLTGVKLLAASGQGGCASTTSKVFCWGSNPFHDLGVDVDVVTKPSGLPTLRAAPVINSGAASALAMSGQPIPVLATFNGTSICQWGSAGAASSCAALSGGTIAQIAASGSGQLACLRSGTRVLCSGNNDYHQCGSINASFVSQPGNDIAVQASDVGTFNSFACALGIDANRTLSCWGVVFGDFSANPTPVWATPTTIGMSNAPAGVRPASLATGGDGAMHLCVIATDGSAWCGGRCLNGACGDGNGAETLNSLTAVHATW